MVHDHLDWIYTVRVGCIIHLGIWILSTLPAHAISISPDIPPYSSTFEAYHRDLNRTLGAILETTTTTGNPRPVLPYLAYLGLGVGFVQGDTTSLQKHPVPDSWKPGELFTLNTNIMASFLLNDEWRVFLNFLPKTIIDIPSSNMKDISSTYAWLAGAGLGIEYYHTPKTGFGWGVSLSESISQGHLKLVSDKKYHNIVLDQEEITAGLIGELQSDWIYYAGILDIKVIYNLKGIIGTYLGYRIGVQGGRLTSVANIKASILKSDGTEEKIPTVITFINNHPARSLFQRAYAGAELNFGRLSLIAELQWNLVYNHLQGISFAIVGIVN